MKKLKDLIPCSCDIEISDIVDDSRLVKKGSLFVATKGFHVDHFDYIEDAVAKGAVAVVVDRNLDLDVLVIVVDDVDDAFVNLCQKFYDVSSDDFQLIGITGTDGKTTSASIVRQLLLPSEEIAYIGTNGFDVAGEHYHTNNTTPCIPELYKCLSIIKQHNCKKVVMEVSSEALLHHRVQGLMFSMVAFTNITEDHLNIHGTIENYRKAKFKLINYLDSDGKAFSNGDDVNCRMLTHRNLSTFGFDINTDFTIFDVNYHEKSTSFKIKNSSNGEIYRIVSPLLGQYNVYNVTLAFVIALNSGISVEEIVSRIHNLSFISGRREMLNFGQSFDIILDYAHTYNGILNILESVQDYRRIITVTGAAGGREKEKRVKIGKLVLEKSDLVIFTMDDPRFEDVNKIIDDMLMESTLNNYERIIDRQEAIYRAFDIAEDGDVVLILGKGRDDYMAIGDKRIPYCDYDVIAKYFN